MMPSFTQDKPWLPISALVAALMLTGALSLSTRAAETPDDSGDTGVGGYSNASRLAGEESSYLFPAYVWGCDNEWRLQLSAYSRLRIENRTNYDMNDRTDDNEKVHLLRTQLKFDLTYRSLIRVFVDMLDARDQAIANLNQQDHNDLHQLFVDVNPTAGSPWTLRFGRQEMKLGNGRIIDSSRWSNLPATWEGLRLFQKTVDGEQNLFLMQPDSYYHMVNGVKTTGQAWRVADQWLFGFHSMRHMCERQALDYYFIGVCDQDNHRTFPDAHVSEEGSYGTAARYTAGSRLYGTAWNNGDHGEAKYDVEGILQGGYLASDDIRAYAFHADLQYHWNHPCKPIVSIVGNVASGDDRFGDGENNTFNPVEGGQHTPYGMIDFTRLQNLREVALRGSIQPTDKLTLRASAHQFWLDSKTDAWYKSSGSEIARDESGRSGRDIGNELDFEAICKLTRRTELDLGTAFFFPGSYARKTGSPDKARLVYLQWSCKF